MTEQHAIPVDQLSRLPVPSSKMSRDVAIRIEALVRDFEGVRAVDGVDLQIPAGEIYGFLGPNGAGKSTTVHMLCTLLAPSGGRALVAGYNVADQPGEVRASGSGCRSRRPHSIRSRPVPMSCRDSVASRATVVRGDGHFSRVHFN